jgi:calcineurin-like phosphoesterase family protein
MALFLTSDSHFGHSGVLAMSKRPFTAGEIRLHDAMLIEAWNARVGRDDDVWHLGDFALGLNRRRLRDVFDQLNGHKRLVRGNHDHRATLALPWAEAPRDLVETTLEGHRVVLSHYPMRAWRWSFHGGIHLYGHMHGRYPADAQSLDVGVDCWSYAPATLPEIRARLAAAAAVEPEERRVGRAAIEDA